MSDCGEEMISMNGGDQSPQAPYEKQSFSQAEPARRTASSPAQPAEQQGPAQQPGPADGTDDRKEQQLDPALFEPLSAAPGNDSLRIMRAPGTHSFAAGYFNFLNSVVGAGIIGLSFALESAGLPLGLLLLFYQGFLTDYSVRLIVRIGDACSVSGYEELCERLLGRPGFLCCAVAMCLFAYGAMVSYLIIIGDTCSAVLGSVTGSELLGERHFIIAMLGATVCFPLSCVRDIGVLARSSAVSIAAVLAIVLIACVRAPAAASEQGILQPAVEPGWLAAGFSATGTMAGSDIVLGHSGCSHAAFHSGTGAGHAPPVAGAAAALSPATPATGAAGFSRTPRNATLAFAVDVRAAYPPPAAGDPDVAVVYAVGSSGVVPEGCGPLTPRHRHDVCRGAVPNATAALRGGAPGTAVLRPARPRVTLSWRPDVDSSGRVALAVSADWSDAWCPGAVGTTCAKDMWTAAHANWVTAFGTMAFAYVCHHSSFLVRNSLREPGQWASVTHASVGTATFLSAVFSVSGYVAFARCTRPNLLNNFEVDDGVINATRLLLALTMFFTFPMEFFVVRQALGSLISRARGTHAERLHWPLTFGIFALTLPPGLLLHADDLGLVLELTGGVAASILAFLLPAALWCTHHRRFHHTWRALVRVPGAGIVVALGCTGTASLLLTLIMTFGRVVGVIDHYKHPPYCPRTGI